MIYREVTKAKYHNMSSEMIYTPKSFWHFFLEIYNTKVTSSAVAENFLQTFYQVEMTSYFNSNLTTMKSYYFEICLEQIVLRR